MSIYVKHIAETEYSAPAIILCIEEAEDVAAFKQLIQQGSNLVPDLPASMKELADLVTVGHIQQNYRSQR